MSTVLYFDCQSGVSGDMVIGALLDLGLDRKQFAHRLNGLNLEGYTLQITQKKVSTILATDFEVILENHRQKHPHVHRNLKSIAEIIEASDLCDTVKQLSLRTFRCIAEAEAKVHRLALDEVHFHEVGAVDSIVDVVGSSLCISMLGADVLLCSPLHLGTGFTRCAHGTIPIPAPATLEIVKGVPVYSSGVRGELVTPTGAAIVRMASKTFVPFPLMAIDSIGYGRGKRHYGIPNCLRVYQGHLLSWPEDSFAEGGLAEDHSWC